MSTVFTCSLDAQSAFDGFPIPILLYKAMDTIPDPSWNILYYWYSKMSACIRWNNSIGRQLISIECGTRQGGPTSPLIFNLFYEELISDLNQLDYGITVGNSNYNVICCADDILVCSLTVTGLQKLTHTAMSYSENYGLKFSAAKTNCAKTYFKMSHNCTVKNERLRDGPFNIQGGAGIFPYDELFFSLILHNKLFFSKVNCNKIFIFLEKTH